MNKSKQYHLTYSSLQFLIYKLHKTFYARQFVQRKYFNITLQSYNNTPGQKKIHSHILMKKISLQSSIGLYFTIYSAERKKNQN